VSIRLPDWAKEYLDEGARRRGKSKTDVILEALSCLRARERAELMREGYLQMREQHEAMAEEDSAATLDILPEW